MSASDNEFEQYLNELNNIPISGVATRCHGGARGRAPPQPRPGPPMRFMQIRGVFFGGLGLGGGVDV